MTAFRAHSPNVIHHPQLRQGVKLSLDALLALTAWAAEARIDSGPAGLHLSLAAWAVLAMGVNLLFQFTRQHYRLVGFKDALRLGLGVLALACAGTLYSLLALPQGPLSPVPFVLRTSILTGFLWMLPRVLGRLVKERRSAGAHHRGHGEPDARHRTLIVGAGRAGLLVAQELQRHLALQAQPVGFVDDDPSKQGIRIQGIPVLGTTSKLQDLVGRHGIRQVVLAIPSAPGQVIRELSAAIQVHGVQVKTVPGIFNLLGNQPWKPEIRDVSIEDLLRREPVQLDQSALSHIIEDSVVLITGAGGSIGSELARQAAAFRPARIVLLGRGENSLWGIEQELRATFPNQSLAVELADIRNEHRLNQAFARWQPQIVLHAAAHKHVPYLEAHPSEAILNNVFGTHNVLSAARAHGAHTFVNVSTDKAVNPTNVLGVSKRIAEYLVLRTAAQDDRCRYMSVRFGNVLGSRGSVLPVFRAQIKRGGPLTVTHPDMTRYFMTIPEASQLVLQAGALGDTGMVYVLDMGEPVKILHLAEDMARLSGFTPGQDIEIKFTGVRPGEKLFEELFTDQEQQRSEVHSKVLVASPDAPDMATLQEGLEAMRKAVLLPDGTRQRELLQWFCRLVPSYRPSPTGLGRYSDENGNREFRVSGSYPSQPSSIQ